MTERWSTPPAASRAESREAAGERGRRLRTMADSAPVLIWMSDATGGCTYVNAGWLRFTGRRLDEELGDGWAEGVHPGDLGRCLEVYRSALSRREPYEMDYRLRRADGEYRWVVDHGVPLWGRDEGFEGFIGSCIDVTERRRAEERDRLLADIGPVLDRPLSLEERLDELARTLLPRIADACVVDLLDDDGTLQRAAAAHVDPAYREMLASLPPPQPDSPIGTVAAGGEPVLVADVSEEVHERASRGADEAALRRRIATRSAVVVPLIARGRRIGVLALSTSRDHSDRSLDEEDLRLAERIAGRAALAIDNARLYRVQSVIADTLQRALLPASLPEVPGAVLGAAYVPTGTGVEAGGDFYDVFACDGDRWIVVVGDVCGKGPEAAALTALARYTLRALAPLDPDPSTLLARLNAAVVGQRPGSTRYLTACAGLVGRGGGGLTVALAAAGHPPPLVLRADGGVERTAPRGPLLGIHREVAFAPAEAVLGPGDRLILYTDGVTEVRTGAGLFGEDRLADAAASLAGVPAARLPGALAERARAAARGPLRDDLAILVVEAARSRR